MTKLAGRLGDKLKPLDIVDQIYDCDGVHGVQVGQVPTSSCAKFRLRVAPRSKPVRLKVGLPANLSKVSAILGVRDLPARNRTGGQLHSNASLLSADC